MPLIKSGSDRAFKRNVSTLMRDVGKSPKVKTRDQALAISYAIKRRGKRRGGPIGYADGGEVDPAMEAQLAREAAALSTARGVKPEGGRTEGIGTQIAEDPLTPLSVLPLAAPLRAAGAAMRYAPKLAAGLGALGLSTMPEEAEGQGRREAAPTPRQMRDQVRIRDMEERMRGARETEQAKTTMPELAELEAMGFTPQTWLGLSAQAREAARNGMALRRVDQQMAAKRSEEEKLKAEAPFRERHPGWSQAAPYLASGAAFALPTALRGAGKFMHDLPYAKAWNKTLGATGEAIDTAGRTSPPATRGLAELEARLAEQPARTAAASKTNWPIIGSSALLGAEGMMFPEQLDYLGQPKGTRAHEEARAAFSDPAYLAKLGLSSLSAGSASKLGDVVGKQAFRTEYPTAATVGMLAPLPRPPRARAEPIDRALLAERLQAEGTPAALSGKLPSGVPMGQDAAGRFTFQGPDGQWRYGNGKLVPSELKGHAMGGRIADPALAAAFRVRRANGGEVAMPAVEDSGPLHEGPVVSDVPGRTDKHNIRVRAGSYVLPSSHVASLAEDNTIGGFSVLDKMFKQSAGATAPKIGAMRGLRGPNRKRRAFGGGLGGMFGGMSPATSPGAPTVSGMPQASPSPAVSPQGPSPSPWGQAQQAFAPLSRAMSPYAQQMGQAFAPMSQAFQQGGQGQPPPPNWQAGLSGMMGRFGGGQGMMHRADGGMVPDEGDVPIVVAGGEYVLNPEQVMQIGGGDIKHGHEILDAWVKSGRKKHIQTLQRLPGPAKS